jgi:hypothetical protein
VRLALDSSSLTTGHPSLAVIVLGTENRGLNSKCRGLLQSQALDKKEV